MEYKLGLKSLSVNFIEKLRSKFYNDVHLRELISGSATFFIFKVLGISVTYLFALVVTRKLGASSWGIFALSLTILQISAVIGKFGLDTALLKLIAQFNAQDKRLIAKKVYLKSLGLIFPLSMFLSMLLYFLSHVISVEVFKKPHLAPCLRLISFALVPCVLVAVNAESLRAIKKIREFVIFQTFLPFFLGLILLEIIFYIGINSSKSVFLAYITGIIISCLLSFIVFYTSFLQNVPMDKDLEREIPSFKHILSISWPMFISSSLGMVLSWTDTIMLGMWRTGEEVGIYNIAVRLSMIISFILTAINSIIAPKIAEFWEKKDIKNLKDSAKRSSKLSFLLSSPLFVVLFLFSDHILGIFGEEFMSGSLSLKILSVGQFISSICGSVGWILQMTNYHKFYASVIFISTIINVSLNYILIPIYGMLGAAIGTTISLIFWNLISLAKVQGFIKGTIIHTF